VGFPCNNFWLLALGCICGRHHNKHQEEKARDVHVSEGFGLEREVGLLRWRGPANLSRQSNASERIIFVTPYIGLWEHLKSKIEEAISEKVEITFLIRDFD